MSIVLQPHTEERLCSDEMIWLSTVRPNGRPHSVPVWFLWTNTTILIFSEPNNQKIRNLRQNHYVTLTLDDTKKGHDVVIIEGTAELLEHGGINNEALQTYGKKYHEGLSRMGMTANLFTLRYSQPIQITPTRLIAG